jgi:CelD/BcsL family acetyltransferase involved in cellulose biosynthesis
MSRSEVFFHPDEFPADVRDLFSQGASEYFENSVPWYCNLINEVFPHHPGIRFHVLRVQGRAVAILPLIAQKSATGSCAESLANYYTSLYSPILDKSVEVRDLAFLLKSVRDSQKSIGSFRFAPMDGESQNCRMLKEALKTAGFMPFSFLCFGNWFLPVRTDWATYLVQQTSGLRSTIKRHAKKLAQGGGRLELVSDETELERGLAAYQSVYAQSWKQPEPFPNFVPGLIRTCAAQGTLRLGLAWLEEKPIAAQLWIVSNGKANIYKVAYDEAYKAYSPGTLVMAMLMEHVMDKDKVAEVDFLIGDDAYKKVWMTDRRERWGVIAYNPKTISGLLGLFREVAGRAIKLIRARLKTAATHESKTENKA